MDYGQRHAVELEAAKRIAQALGAAGHRVQKLDLARIGGSALTDRSIAVPTGGVQAGIPVTYVPARNNAVDYSGYPDCRPEFLVAFEKLANLATKAAVEGRRIEVRGPLVDLPKAAIVKLALELGVDPAMTVSCYQPDGAGRACGACDACRIRRAGFEAAAVPDTTRYTG